MSATLIIFTLYFAAIIVITYRGTRRNESMGDAGYSEEFFVGGRKIGPVALAILVAAGACSTGTFIGGPGLSALNGPGFMLLFGMGQIPMTLFILGILGKKINIIGRRTGSETFIDIFRYRFENWGPLIFILAAAILVVLTVSSSAEFIGGSRVIEAMTGIPYIYSLIAFGVLITFYTALGGMNGVSMVGILQGFIMTAATIILVAGYLTFFGGFPEIIGRLREIDPLLLTPTHGGDFPMFTMMSYWLTYSICIVGLPWAVQSALTYKSTQTMKMGIVIGIVFVTIWTLFICNLGGAAGRAYTPDLPVSDFAIPYLAQGTLSPMLAGIVLAGVAGAGQSTIAALFILASGSVVVNVYRGFLDPQASTSRIRKLSVLVTAAVGIVNMIIAASEPPTLQVFITFAAGGAGAALIAPMILGLYWPRCNKYGALCGVFAGLVAYAAFSLMTTDTPLIHEAPLICSIVISFLLTWGVSLITRKPDRETLQIYFGE